MWLLALEAGVAMFMLIFIVWWTMFHGRAPERPETPPKEDKKLIEQNKQSQDIENPQ